MGKEGKTDENIHMVTPYQLSPYHPRVISFSLCSTAPHRNATTPFTHTTLRINAPFISIFISIAALNL